MLLFQKLPKICERERQSGGEKRKKAFVELGKQVPGPPQKKINENKKNKDA